MRRFFVFFIIFLSSECAFGETNLDALKLSDPLPGYKSASPPNLQLPTSSNKKLVFSLYSDSLPISQMILLYYEQCEKRGLIFDPDAAKLEEKILIKADSLTCAEAKSMVLGAISRGELGLENHASYDVVKKIRKQDDRKDWEQLIFKPRFRDPVELADQCTVAYSKGSFAHQRKMANVTATATQGESAVQQVPDTGSNGASITSKEVETLIFYGPADEVKAVRDLLQLLDTPYKQVEISAGLYEYQAGSSSGSAVTAALKLFGAKLGLSLGSGTRGGASTLSSSGSASSASYNTLSFATPDFSAVLSLLDEDSHFRSVSRPKVLARSGQQVVFTTGQDVMVPGPITINASGQSLQSLVNVTAGVTFQVTPQVRGDVVNVSLHETVSDFVPSPNANPSILKRDLVADLMMRPGVVYVIGGLNANNQTTSKSTFFGFKIGEQFTRNDTEILLLLTVKEDATGI
ncbi:hypothetical protein FEE59_10100 [Herbaspirillum sp. RU 5E]|nr:hypothetical protein [Herbaspirillum sp. RU 5E]